MLDTGSTKSFINPEIAEKYFSKFIKYDPYVISTAHGTSNQNYSISIPCPKLFKSNNLSTKFHIFKFHKYFDCLLGIDNLQNLEALIDLKNHKLILPNTKIDIKLKKLSEYNINCITVQPQCKKAIKVKIDNIENGIALLPEQEINGLQLPECLIEVKNNYAFTTANNPSEKQISFDLGNCSFQAIPENQFVIPENNLNNFETSKFKFDLSKVRLSHTNQEERKQIIQLLKSYADIFHFDNDKLTFTNSVKHEIKLKNETPIHTKTYRYPQVHKAEVEKQINSMLEQGIIKHSQSPWSSPIWIVPKKLDASGIRKWRIVIDYRKLNEQTIDDRYPIPNINDILDKLGKSQYFTTLDLKSGFHQIEMAPQDTCKTAFSTEYGLFEFLRMPFGLKNSPSTFQRVMDNVLCNVKNCVVYLDDIIIFSTSLQEHILNLKNVFDRLRKFNLKVQLDKCEFLKKEVHYLGHVITPFGIKPNPDKIQAILDYPIPRTTKQLKGFLGLIGYYRKFIKNFAKITKPLTSCLKKDNSIDITNPDYINCFNHCKTLLTNEPILQYPDFEKPFVLTTDASNYAIGAILSQGPIGSDLPISYASRTLNEHEINYSVIEKELLAIVWATKYFRPYLFGQKFKIVTDHKPLQWLFSLKEPNSKLVRWRLRLEEYDYEICYKKGKLNQNADALSRIPNLNINETESPFFEYMKQFNAKFDKEKSNKEDDNNSLIVETPEIDDHAMSDFDDGNTIHTSHENPICNIEITEDPLNFAKNQIHLILVKSNPAKPSILKLFSNSKQRFVIQLSENNYGTEFTEFVRNYIVPNVSYSLYFDNDKLFQLLQPIIQQNFDSNLKFKKCTKILEDVTDENDQQYVIQMYHTGKTNHRGMNETLAKLTQKYYWPNLQKSIQNYINNCDICQVVKYDRKPLKLKFNITPTPVKPFEIVHADILTYNKNKFLTIVDAFSKYAQAYILKTLQAQEISENLMHYFSHHSTPHMLVVDNGSEFDNGLIKEFLTLHKIETHFCSPHHPASNGIIERFHSTLLEHVNLINNQDEFKNDSIATKFMYAIIAYNNSIHSATKMTPFEILNGHYDSKQILDTNFEQQLINNFVQNHRTKIETLHKIVNTNLKNQKEHKINKLNENREEVPKLPEKVFVKSNFRSKSRNRYKKEKIISVDYDRKTIKPEIDLSKTGRKFTKLHISNVKRPNENVLAGTSACGSSSQQN